jgi:hypothetical protein
MKHISEKQAKAGDIIKAINGNLYLILPNKKQIYMGNSYLSRIPGQEQRAGRPNAMCEVMGHIDIAEDDDYDVENNGL